MSLETAIIVGASTGIGRATAVELARQGCSIVAAGIGSRELELLADEVEDQGQPCHVVQGDLRDQAVVDRLLAVARQSGAPVRRLVCSVGIQRYGTVEETNDDQLKEVLDTNFGVAFRVCRAVIPLLRVADGEAIAVVSSVQGTAPQAGVAAYAASKAALLSLVRSLAVDYAADGIRAVSISPGSVDTPMLREAASQFLPDTPVEQVLGQWGSMHPLGRVARAEEVAALIAFLTSPQAGFITGCDIRVDGGLLAQLPVAHPKEP